MWKEQSQNFYKRDSYPCDSSTKISSARHTKSTKAKDRCIVTKSFRLTKAAQRRREATPENPREATPPPGARSAQERPRPCNRRAPGWRSPRSPRQRAESEHAAGPWRVGSRQARDDGAGRRSASNTPRETGRTEQLSPPGASGPVWHVPRRPLRRVGGPCHRAPSLEGAGRSQRCIVGGSELRRVLSRAGVAGRPA